MKKRYTETQIVAKRRQADVLIGKGNSVPEVCREIEVSQQASGPSSVTENSVEAGKSPGVHYLRKENNEVIYEAESGPHGFVFSIEK